jgi:hypothetical protein
MGFWSKILNSNDATSSKRLITLVVALHFVISSFVILFLVCYIAMYLPKGRIEKELLVSLSEILEYDFYIIVSGLGFVTGEGIVKMFVSKHTPPNPGYGYGSGYGYGYPNNQYDPTNTNDQSPVSPPGDEVSDDSLKPGKNNVP